MSCWAKLTTTKSETTKKRSFKEFLILNIGSLNESIFCPISMKQVKKFKNATRRVTVSVLHN